jgi:hypothetical protein
MPSSLTFLFQCSGESFIHDALKMLDELKNFAFNNTLRHSYTVNEDSCASHVSRSRSELFQAARPDGRTSVAFTKVFNDKRRNLYDFEEKS